MTQRMRDGGHAVFRHRQPPHPARRQEALLQHLVEMGQHLGARGQPVQPGVEAVHVLAAVAEFARRHAVPLRGLVQPNKRVGVVPVPAGAVLAVHHQHRRGRVFGQQGVDEGHRRGARADDEVVGLERRSCRLPAGLGLSAAIEGGHANSPMGLTRTGRSGRSRCRASVSAAAGPAVRRPHCRRTGTPPHRGFALPASQSAAAHTAIAWFAAFFPIDPSTEETQ